MKKKIRYEKKKKLGRIPNAPPEEQFKDKKRYSRKDKHKKIINEDYYGE